MKSEDRIKLLLGSLRNLKKINEQNDRITPEVDSMIMVCEWILEDK